jgi:hypothetical protein
MKSEHNEKNEKLDTQIRAAGKVGAASLAIGLTVVLGTSPAHAEFVVQNRLYGFVAAGNNGAMVTTDQRFSYNFADNTQGSSASITVTRAGRGHYWVNFPQLGQPTGLDAMANANGIVEVTGFNGLVLANPNVRCKPSTWSASPSNNTLSIEIWCFTPAGAVSDGFFAANYLKRFTDFMDPLQDSAYAYVSDATSAIGTTYNVTDPHSYNSMQQPINVTRQATGVYDIYFVGQRPGYPFPVPNGCSPAPGYSGGTVEVTAVGTDSAFCKNWSWWDTGSDTFVRVLCFDTSGNPVNSKFNVKYSNAYPEASSNQGFGWVDGVGTPVGGNSNADPGYSAELDYVDDSNGCGHYETYNDGSQVVPILSHGGTGKYGIQFPQLGATPHSTSTMGPFDGPANAMFTTYNDGADYCNFVGWSYSSSSGMTLFSQCFGANGALKDVQFNASYAYLGEKVP